VNPSSEERLAGLLGQAESMAQAMRGTYRPPQEVAESSDSSGAVTVTVSDFGRRVTRVTVAADWRDRVGAEELAAAVMEAVVSVQLGPVRDFFTAATGDAVSAPAGQLPPAPAVTDLGAGLDWDELGRMFDTVQRALDAVVVGQAGGQDATSPGITRHSENRRVSVSLIGGQLGAVTIDSSWAERVGRQQLSESLLEAFDAAYAGAAEVRPGNPASASGMLGELQSIMDRIGVNPQTNLKGQ
jgi:DNA-binding protein YbaB